MGGSLINKSAYPLMWILECTPVHSTISHFPTNFRWQVFCYWGRIELALLVAGRRFVNPSSQSSRDTVRKNRRKGECRDTHLDIRIDLFPQVD